MENFLGTPMFASLRFEFMMPCNPGGPVLGTGVLRSLHCSLIAKESKQ